jgi:hypothetical protein
LCRSFIISMRTAKQDQERYQQQKHQKQNDSGNMRP